MTVICLIIISFFFDKKILIYEWKALFVYCIAHIFWLKCSLTKNDR